MRGAWLKEGGFGRGSRIRELLLITGRGKLSVSTLSISVDVLARLFFRSVASELVSRKNANSSCDATSIMFKATECSQTGTELLAATPTTFLLLVQTLTANSC